MININVTLFIQIANFLILLFLMNLVLYRPIRRIVAQRKQTIESQQGEIDRADAGAVAAVQEFNSGLSAARKVGRERIQELKAVAYEQEKDLLQKATEQAAKQVKDMRAQVQREIAAARDQLSAQVKAFSIDLAQKILGRTI